MLQSIVGLHFLPCFLGALLRMQDRSKKRIKIEQIIIDVKRRMISVCYLI